MKYDYSNVRHPAMVFVLRGLMPTTRENLLLSFKPGQFFYELSLVSGHSQTALRSAYYRARKQDLLSSEKVPRLTCKGMRKVAPFVAKKLGSNARLIVFFDIPEYRLTVRNSFRNLLKSLGFVMIQQSVWTSDNDYKKVLIDAVKEFRLDGCVEIHESLRLYPK